MEIWAAKNARCLKDQLVFRRAISAGPSYEQIATIPTYTPPIITPEGKTTQAQADALNAFSLASAKIAAIQTALETTKIRLGDASLAQAWEHAANQFAAYRSFMLDYANQLDALTQALDALLLATEGAGVPDELFIYDPQAEAEDLKTNGFEAETITYYQNSGLSNTDIDVLRQDTIAQLEADSQTATYLSFYAELKQWRDSARSLAVDLREQFGPLTARASLAGPPTFSVEPMQTNFEVGNPTDKKATVELVVRPINLPLNWTYSLDTSAVELEPRELVTATLTLQSNQPMLEETEIQVAVEGYIGADLIGGITFSRRMPKYLTEPIDFKRVYLPLIVK